MYVGNQIFRLLGIVFMVTGGLTAVAGLAMLFAMGATGQGLVPALLGRAVPALTFLVVGGVFLGWANRVRRQLTWLRNNGVPVQGRIIDKTTSPTYVNNYHYRIAHVQIPNGRTFRSEPFDDRKWWWEIGDQITVFVHPTDPTQGFVDLSPEITDHWSSDKPAGQSLEHPEQDH